jgi:hypothetical protein
MLPEKLERMARFHRLGKCLAMSVVGSAALVFPVWAWPQSDIPVRVFPVGSTLMVNRLSSSDVAEIKKIAHRQAE